MNRLLLTLATMASLATALPAQAALEARYLDADSTPDAYYDTDQDITWLKDAGAIEHEMNWADATQWASALNVGGYTHWRLPTTVQFDAGCSDRRSTGDLGLGCTVGEMAYLNNVYGISDAAPNPFERLHSGLYWTSTEIEREPGGAWAYAFSVDVLHPGTGWKTGDWADRGVHWAWAVKDGSIGTTGTPVTSVPEPETWALMLAGLGLLGLSGRRRTRASACAPCNTEACFN